MDPSAKIPQPSKDAFDSAQAIYAAIKKQAQPLADEFESRYAAWQKTWFAGANASSPNAADHTESPEFAALVALGPKITPLVVQKLTQPSDLFAVELYNRLDIKRADEVNRQDLLNYKQDKVDATIEAKEDKTEAVADIHHVVELEAMASLILENNLACNTAFDSNLALWKEHLDLNALANNSSQKTEGDGYWNLVDQGTRIVARLMLEYYEDPSGWWHELLHEVIHGDKSGSPVFFKDALFEQWKGWFEKGEWKDVPKGRGVEGDRLYKVLHPEEFGQDAA